MCSNNSRSLLLLEMLALFFFLPLSYLFPIPFGIKLGLTILALVWVFRCAWKMSLFSRLGSFLSVDKNFLLGFGLRLFIGLGGTYILMSIYYPEDRFVVFSHMGFFIRIVFIYSFLSVSVQELIYRPFFFQRYGSLFARNRWGMLALIFINALLFAWAHAFFGSWLVVVVTFFGGLFFAYSWYRYQSYTWVWLEHAIYGLWLFALGIGSLLAFPMPEPVPQ